MPTLTRADRLEALCVALHPPFGKYLPAEWGPTGCPYLIDEFNGLKRIRVTDPKTGDTIAATGADMNEAMSKLERRFELYKKEGV